VQEFTTGRSGATNIQTIWLDIITILNQIMPLRLNGLDATLRANALNFWGFQSSGCNANGQPSGIIPLLGTT
jgi:hypothetical protein